MGLSVGGVSPKKKPNPIVRQAFLRALHDYEIQQTREKEDCAGREKKICAENAGVLEAERGNA